MKRVFGTVCKSTVLAIVLSAVVIFGLFCRRIEKVSFTYFALDTIVSFTMYHGGEKDRSGCGIPADAVIEADIGEILERYERVFSPTNPESELYKINHLEWKPDNSSDIMTVPISEDLYRCISLCSEYYDITGGRYNAAVRPVTQLWNFRDNPKGDVPSQDDIREALALIADISCYEVKKMNGVTGNDTLNAAAITGNISAGESVGSGYAIILKQPGIGFDLGSVAKGYIADRIADYCRANGIYSAVTDLGGNIYCLGYKYYGYPLRRRDFKVGIQAPLGEKGSVSVKVAVRNKSVVTSGSYQRYFVKNGELYHHILDATTGYPAESDLASVSVIADSSAKADVLSTVCFILGEKKATEFLAAEGAEGVFIGTDGTVSCTDGVKKAR